ncbi:flavodoxin family protein [Thalassotalea litorea]|uniref:Flavodoxin family protein n=1 Tax=Thalassotalea litorea TaxID=2020715 RepID=A0A5R9IS35_9GAMM|nr:NAD(P)H-dependent oxidoreductase [Thalassotalea litorea]TLU66877.1 flavodoxin family protein [Thalassotalea litorea]
MSQSKILVLFAHPSLHRSEANAPIFQQACEFDFVTAVDLYAEYPRLNIDIDREQQRLLAHDIVIFQFPIYWYSTPAILKEWQDLVLEYGFAYGQDGNQLKGKTFLCAVTAGGSVEAYRQGGHNNFTVRELFRPLEQTAIMTGMHYLPPLTLFGSRTATDENRLPLHLQHWTTTLDMLHEGQIDIQRADSFITLNDYLTDKTMGIEKYHSKEVGPDNLEQEDNR